jgi:ribonuclease E
MVESPHVTDPDLAAADDAAEDSSARQQPTTTEPASAARSTTASQPAAHRRRAASRPAGPPTSHPETGGQQAEPAVQQTTAQSAGTADAAKDAHAEGDAGNGAAAEGDTGNGADAEGTGSKSAAAKTTAKKSAAKKPGQKKAVEAQTGSSGSSAVTDTTEVQSAADQQPEATRTAANKPAAKRAAAKKTSTKKTPSAKAAAANESAGDEAGAVSGGPAPAAETPAPADSPADTGKSAEPDAAAPAEMAESQTGAAATSPDETPRTDPAIEAALESAWKHRQTKRTESPDADNGHAAETPQGERAGESAQDNSSAESAPATTADQSGTADQQYDPETDDESAGNNRRRRRRGGRRRRRSSTDRAADDANGETAGADEADSTPEDTDADNPAASPAPDAAPDAQASTGNNGEDTGGRRRRRRRRRRGESAETSADDPQDVVVKVRDRRSGDHSDEVTGVDGSTRIEAKRQRRREGRESGRRRAPILSEAEFLARREAVNRTMIIRQLDEFAQIAVLEDGILVEHYVDRADSGSLIGNVYLGRVQNVLPSMEAAFVDIGRGRNAVLYAGDLDWDGLGAGGEDRKIENVLKSGQTVQVQVTKDPIGAKGARLTHRISMPGRYVVYAPAGHMSGISRKLPDEERQRLKNILAGPVGDDASVIIRTAAEGASEDELTRDVSRLQAQWQAIESKVKAGQAPQLLYAEPDLTLRIVRDLFTEDFAELIIQGNGSMTDAYDSVEAYLQHVAPHLTDRVRRWDAESAGDLFGSYRLDEQIAKALERKVFLPSGGSLIIDRTEAMTVIDVNTGKFTGSGGNLEATVTSNNLEAAEEIVRQLRLRDVGGIVVIDFIDMVLPSNRELLLKRLIECLGRDRTRHQVAEVTSLGLVQMTRKRIGSGLLEGFSTECPHCHGRGVELHDMPVVDKQPADGGTREDQNRGRNNRRRGRGHDTTKKDAPTKAKSARSGSGNGSRNDQASTPDHGENDSGSSDDAAATHQPQPA